MRGGHKNIEREAALDGIYVVRTRERPVVYRLRIRCAAQIRRRWNALCAVLKGIDILVRPIRHRDEQRVKAHLYLCMLAYYVEWHMRRALAPLLQTTSNWIKSSLRPAIGGGGKPSASAKKKGSACYHRGPADSQL